MGLRTIAEMDGFSICRRTTINMKSSGMKSAMAQADRILLRSSPAENTSPEMGILLGHALAMDNRKVVVGRDLMRSSSMMKEALVAGLTSSGADVLDVGVVSCPALALAASKGDCAVYVTEYRGYGMTSGYLLVNPNGSLFRKEQLRHLEMYLVDPPKLPESGGLGHVYEVYGVTICTGYRGMPGRSAYGTTLYEEQAQKVAHDYSKSWDERREEVEELLKRFCAENGGKAARL